MEIFERREPEKLDKWQLLDIIIVISGQMD